MNTLNKCNTLDCAQKVADYLGISENHIDHKNGASMYITYTYNGVDYQLRISDHSPNPRREDVIKDMGYTPIDCTNDWTIAKRVIDRKIFRKNIIPNGNIVSHPTYGEGTVIAHDINIDKVEVNFGSQIKSFYGAVLLDRGWAIAN